MYKSLFFTVIILTTFSFTQNDTNSKTEPDFDRYIGVVKSIYDENKPRYGGFVFGFPKAGWGALACPMIRGRPVCRAVGVDPVAYGAGDLINDTGIFHVSAKVTGRRHVGDIQWVGRG